MAAEAPAPGRRTAGLAEDPQVVQAGVAAPFAAPVDGPALDVIEDVVQPDTRGDGDVPGGGQPAGDQLVSTALLGWPLVRQGQATVVRRGVEPAPPVRVGLGVRAGRATGGYRALRRVECAEPGRRGGGHTRRDLPGCDVPVCGHAG